MIVVRGSASPKRHICILLTHFKCDTCVMLHTGCAWSGRYATPRMQNADMPKIALKSPLCYTYSHADSLVVVVAACDEHWGEAEGDGGDGNSGGGEGKLHGSVN